MHRIERMRVQQQSESGLAHIKPTERLFPKRPLL